MVFAAAKQNRHPRTRDRGPSLVTFVGLVLAATGLATLALVLLTSTTLAQSAPELARLDRAVTASEQGQAGIAWHAANGSLLEANWGDSSPLADRDWLALFVPEF